MCTPTHTHTPFLHKWWHRVNTILHLALSPSPLVYPDRPSLSTHKNFVRVPFIVDMILIDALLVVSLTVPLLMDKGVVSSLLLLQIVLW